jgi:hypothetical protein
MIGLFSEHQRDDVYTYIHYECSNVKGYEEAKQKGSTEWTWCARTQCSVLVMVSLAETSCRATTSTITTYGGGSVWVFPSIRVLSCESLPRFIFTHVGH